MATTEAYEAELVEDDVRELAVQSPGALSVVAAAEIDTQIATARKYPRSISMFRRNAEALACLDEETAAACVYSLPRGGKPITGPSVRMAEIVAATYGNCRIASRVIDIDDKFVVAEGAFHDLETNTAVRFEVRRRITDKTGKRFNDDMILVTAQAACSIAVRNAIFKGAPKALWKGVYDKACRMIQGEGKTLKERQDACVAFWKAKGVKPPQVAAFCGRRDVADLTGDDLVALVGLWNAIKDGETTIAEAFSPKQAGAAGVSPLNEKAAAAMTQAPATEDHYSRAVAAFEAAKTLDDVAAVWASLKGVDLPQDQDFRLTELGDAAAERIRAAGKKK